MLIAVALGADHGAMLCPGLKKIISMFVQLLIAIHGSHAGLMTIVKINAPLLL